jgi:hypothetical protein
MIHKHPAAIDCGCLLFPTPNRDKCLYLLKIRPKAYGFRVTHNLQHNVLTRRGKPNPTENQQMYLLNC